MIRREFIAMLGAAAGWPLGAKAQQPKVPVIGVLAGSSSNVDEKRMVSFYRGLSESGYTDGQNVVISYLNAEGHYDRLAALATELVRRQVDMIVIFSTTPAAVDAKSATSSIPILFSVTSDPVKLGLVSSLVGRAETQPGCIISTRLSEKSVLDYSTSLRQTLQL